MDNTHTPVVGRREDGSTVWYTGKAGQEFVSENPADAWTYPTVESARRRAFNLNHGTSIHGIRFVAAVNGVDGVLSAEAYREFCK
jgi:hypothetical protein